MSLMGKARLSIFKIHDVQSVVRSDESNLIDCNQRTYFKDLKACYVQHSYEELTRDGRVQGFIDSAHQPFKHAVICGFGQSTNSIGHLLWHKSPNTLTARWNYTAVEANSSLLWPNWPVQRSVLWQCTHCPLSLWGEAVPLWGQLNWSPWDRRLCLHLGHKITPLRKTKTINRKHWHCLWSESLLTFSAVCLCLLLSLPHFELHVTKVHDSTNNLVTAVLLLRGEAKGVHCMLERTVSKFP